VRYDVICGLVSPEQAEACYGVVFKTGFEIDLDRSEPRRSV
jgi:hypothetical protein